MIQTKNLFSHILRNSLLQSTFPFMNNWEIKLPELLPQINHSLLKTPTSNQGHQLMLWAFHYFIDRINIPFQMEVLSLLWLLSAKLQPIDNTTCTSYLWKMPGCSLRDSKICSGANCIWDQNPAARLCSRRHCSPCKQKGYIRGEWQEGWMVLFYRLETVGWIEQSKGIDGSSGRTLKWSPLGFSSGHNKTTPFSMVYPLIS